jgi:sulfate adenylyltransferase
MKMDVTFWCYRCGGMASSRTCPHEAGDRLQVSGTQLRKSLESNEPVPPEFSRGEVLEILREYYASIVTSDGTPRATSRACPPHSTSL